MPISGQLPADAPAGLEAPGIVARFCALIAAGCADLYANPRLCPWQDRNDSGQERWGDTRQKFDAEAFVREMALGASPMAVRQALEDLLRDYRTLVHMPDAGYIPRPWGWRAIVWRELAEKHWTVADAIDFVRAFLTTESADIRYWEAKEAVVFFATFYEGSPEVVASMLEARAFCDFGYVVDLLIMERFSPTELWIPALRIAVRGSPDMLLVRLTPLLQTHPNIRAIVEDALQADPLKFTQDSWKIYASGAPRDQAFRAGMDEIVETLIPAMAGSRFLSNNVPFDLYMLLYPADDAALRHCLRAVFDGGENLHPAAVDWLGRRFWRFEQTKPALLRVMHEGPDPYVRTRALYWLMLRYGTEAGLRASIFQAAAAESMPEAHEAMMHVLGGEPVNSLAAPSIATRSKAENHCELQLFRSVYALVQADACRFLPADFLRYRIRALIAKLAFLKPSILLEELELRRAADRDDREYYELLVQREHAERERAVFEDALQRATGSTRAT